MRTTAALALLFAGYALGALMAARDREIEESFWRQMYDNCETTRAASQPLLMLREASLFLSTE